MGLKSDIYAAFEKNLGKDFVDSTADGKKKVDDLAEDISKAIINWVKAQTFNITEMEAPYNILPGKVAVATAGSPAAQSGANTAPVIGVVQISETSNKVGLPTVNTNVRKSKVKLISVKEA